MTPRLLTIMGSGETSPTMVKVHRRLFDRLGEGAEGVVLDTPYAFQENARDISRKAVEYFWVSVGRRFRVTSFRADGSALEAEQALEELRRAAYVFAGPGSPTHALRHWKGSAVPEVLAEKLVRGGAVTFASAAALTLGGYTVPVYEIYKAGEDPHWVEGLDLLGGLGLEVAVIPHYDNAEGGTHDTRYAYLGETRLRVMEEALPEEAFVLGVDEHTACLIDLEVDTLQAEGRGGVTIRRKGRVRRVSSGERIPLSDLRGSGGLSLSGRPGGSDRAHPRTTPFEEDVSALEERFAEALREGGADQAVAAILELEALLEAWGADPTQSEARDRARRLLRSMIVRVGEAAEVGLRRPEEVLGPLVEALLEAREAARRRERWGEADAIRDRLEGLGVEVRDTPEGTVWALGEDVRRTFGLPRE